MEEKLYLNNILIDLPTGSVSLTNQINDIGELKDRQADYTNNIKIPKTAKNIKTFEMLGIAGNTTRIPYENVAVKYVVDGIELISQGYGVIKNTNDYYNLVVYDGNISMIKLLEGEKLNELDFTAHNHTLSQSLFLNSFTNTSGYIYALAKYYDNFSIDVFNIDLITPSFFVHSLFEMIFTQKGYTISGAIFSDADYKSRVISMNKGFERIDTENLTSVFTRDNSSDPAVTETFAIQTLKEYTIDSYTTVTDGTHNVDLSGLITLTSVKENPTITVKLNGYALLTENLEGLTTIDYNVNVLANSGDVITVNLLLDSIDVSGTQTIAFETNYTTVISTNIITIPIDFNEIIGETLQIDFVKDIMQRFGLIFRKIRNKNEYEFVQIETLLSDIENAEDWSSKYAGFENESYKSKYAQINKMRYLYDDNDTDKDPTYGDGEMLVNDVNLTVEKTLFTSIFKASEYLQDNLYLLQQWEDKTEEIEDVEITTTIPKEDSLRIFKINEISDSFNYRFNSSIQNSTTFTGTIPYLNFNNINYQIEIDAHYNNFNKMLNNYKFITLNLNLSIIDIYNLNFFKLKYFKQLGNYYYLNKVSAYKANKTTKVELIQIGK